MDYKPYIAKKREDLKALARGGCPETIFSLKESDLKSPASRWKHDHLVAYRLLIMPVRPLLPILRPIHDQSCPICHDQHPGQQVDHDWINILAGAGPEQLYTGTESEITALPGGFFWAALARAARYDDTAIIRDRSQRVRQQPNRPGFVRTEDVVSGSSSSSHASAEEYDAEPREVNEEDHEVRRVLPEEITVSMVTAFLHHALSLCLRQAPTTQSEFRVRVERMTATATVAGREITCQDDGGVTRMRREHGRWVTDHPWLVLLEAKRAFQHTKFNVASGKTMPVLKNEHLAQYFGEAVIMWKANRDTIGDNVFMIAAINTFISFIHFEFNNNYMEYLDAPNAAAQEAIINDIDKDAFVGMRRSRWYNLEAQQDRKEVLCHILALVKLHDGPVQFRTGGF